MRPTLTQFKYKDIFNVDELTMYSDVCPLKFDANPQGNKHDSQIINATNLVTILLCCNSSGTDKLPPLITGPYKTNVSRDDCKYYYNENSTINDKIFINWIQYLNQMMSQEKRNILLLLHRHRISALKNIQLSNVKLIFFPANFPPHLRPLRRDVFHSTKMNYRLAYAEKIFQGDCNWELEEMITAILKSWNQVPRELIISSFQRTTFRSDDKLLEISNDDWEKFNTGINFKKLITFDDHLSDASNNVSNDVKQIIREKHNYNLRTSNHEVFQVDELEDLAKLKNECQESLKTEPSITSVNQGSQNANDSHQESDAMDLDTEENVSNDLEVNDTRNLEVNVTRDLEIEVTKDLEKKVSENLDLNVVEDLEDINNNLEENVTGDLEKNVTRVLENIEDSNTNLDSKKASPRDLENLSQDLENSSRDLENSEVLSAPKDVAEIAPKDMEIDPKNMENVPKELEENTPNDQEENFSKEANISKVPLENISKDSEVKDLQENISQNLKENDSKNAEQNIVESPLDLSKNPLNDSAEIRELGSSEKISTSTPESSRVIGEINEYDLDFTTEEKLDSLLEITTETISLCGNSGNIVNIFTI